MKIVILYRPDSEHSRTVETFIHDYKGMHPQDRVEIINIDSRDGAAMASLYDVMSHPTILVTREDGTVLNAWEGPDLPQMDQVAAYAYS